MQFEEFISGSYKQQYEYKSFSPSLVNHEWTWGDPRINTLLEEASLELAKLNTHSLMVPNVDLYIYMHMMKEANSSSRIEGTRTEMDEALRDIAFVDEEKRNDVREVQNYIIAMNSSIKNLKTLPLSNRLLRDAHAMLLAGARGDRKTPGEFRLSQNWIGGSSLADAVFIPPHHEDLPELLSDLEKFWHNEAINVPQLVRIAISHYQFETIHPFLDGNGRIGRLLITLYLLSKGLLDKPCLYLSAFLEKNKGQYYDALTTVRESNDLGHWIRFFLVAVRDTSRKGVDTFQQIMKLRSEVQNRVTAFGARAANGMKLLDRLYMNPVVTVKEAAQALDVAQPTASTLITLFVDQGILVETTGNRRNREFFFRDYYRLFLS
ncbi:MAG: cell filamentation protein Fic [Desulfovibrionales bacterium GWA2_65_9]|nr:MAG: cell filamentation protein Fic [Desulfovibrionales bacterium GWA2_65_9]